MGIIIATLIVVVVIASALAQGTEWTRGEIIAAVQAVGSVVAAFLGFLGGVLIKYRLDWHADRLRGEADRQNLESALRAELLSLDLACDTRINEFEKALNQKPKKEVLGGPHSFARMALPPRRVWMAHLGQIGELKDGNTEALVLVHSLFDSYDLVVETQRQQAGGKGVPREVLQMILNALEKMREAIAKAGGPLFEQTTVDQSWWRRVLDI